MRGFTIGLKSSNLVREYITFLYQKDMQVLQNFECVYLVIISPH